MIAGSVDVSHASGASLTRAAARGQRLLAIVAVLDRASVEIVLRKDVAEAVGFAPQAPLAERAKVLNGRTISIDAINSIDDIFVRVIAQRGGLAPDAVRLAVLQKALENAERMNVEAGLLKPEEKLPSYDGLFTDAYVK